MHTTFLAVALINIQLKRLLGWAGILLDGGQRNDRQLLAIVLHNIAPVGSAHFFCVAATQMYINELVDSRVDLQIEEYPAGVIYGCLVYKRSVEEVVLCEQMLYRNFYINSYAPNEEELDGLHRLQVQCG